MVSINRVDYFILTGHTYGNLDAIKRTGATWDNGAKQWTLRIARHPLNNAKQKAKLQKMLDELEANGVRFIAWYTDGTVKQ